MTNLTGLFVPLVTPFGPDGQVDTGSLQRLACRVLADGATGLVALGTTAEAPTLTAAERRQVLDVCAAVCRDRGAPLIAGVGSSDTRSSAEALTALSAWPEISAALAVVPYYLRPGKRGVLEHFRTLAGAGPVPLIIYNVPCRTGQYVGWDTMRQLAELPGVAGVKHAAGVDQDTMIMMADRPAGFAVLAGDDIYASALLALGADGAILASAHACTSEFAALVSAWHGGQAGPARQLGHRLTRLSAALFAEPNPTVIKAVLHRLGEIPSAAVRLPLVVARADAARHAMEATAAVAQSRTQASRLDPV